MGFPAAERGNTLVIPTYLAASEKQVKEVLWYQNFRQMKKYYFILATNRSKQNTPVLLFVQDDFYNDEDSGEFIGKLPGAHKEDNKFIVAIDDHFKYGENDKKNDRFLVLHNKSHKPYQHRYLFADVSEVTNRLTQIGKWFGVDEDVEVVNRLYKKSVGEHLKTIQAAGHTKEYEVREEWRR